MFSDFIDIDGRKFNAGYITMIEPYETTGYTQGWKIKVVVQTDAYISDAVFPTKKAAAAYIEKLLTREDDKDDELTDVAEDINEAELEGLLEVLEEEIDNQLEEEAD